MVFEGLHLEEAELSTPEKAVKYWLSPQGRRDLRDGTKWAEPGCPVGVTGFDALLPRRFGATDQVALNWISLETGHTRSREPRALSLRLVWTALRSLRLCGSQAVFHRFPSAAGRKNRSTLGAFQELPRNFEKWENHRPGMNSSATSDENPLRWVGRTRGFKRFFHLT